MDRFWIAMNQHGPMGVAKIIRETPHDLLMLNGFFDREFTLRALLARRFGQIPRRPTILSPLGEFGAGALSLQSRAKKAYVAAVRGGGLLSDVWMHASDDEELADINQIFPWAKSCILAQDITPLLTPLPYVSASQGMMRIVFVSRVSRKKNIDGALRILATTGARIAFDIYGPIEDRDYWQECQTLIGALPANVRVEWRGPIANADIPRVFATADLFFLPTLGENFGHAIFEALSCGVPVLISDRTPWKNLAAQHAGWDLPLGDPQAFAAAIDRFAAMDEAERAEWRRGTRALAERFFAQSDAVAKTREMLDTVLRLGTGHCELAATHALGRRLDPHGQQTEG
jgi:glycosyltransferase involved in cell wall biosynthesis